MKTNQAGLDLIKEFEGLALKPYLCPAKIPTIGYGSTRYPNGTPVTLKDKPISKEQAEELLKTTLRSFEIGVLAAVKVPLSENQFSALVSFAYNVGLGNFRSSTLLKLLNSKAKIQDIAAQFHRWNKSGGKVLAGLARRRAAERTLAERTLATRTSTAQTLAERTSTPQTSKPLLKISINDYHLPKEKSWDSTMHFAGERSTVLATKALVLAFAALSQTFEEKNTTA